MDNVNNKFGKIFGFMQLLKNFLKHRKSEDYIEINLNENRRPNEVGFSLIEVVVAMTIFLIAMLGIFVTFVYAVNYNAGNNSRTQALSVLQQEVERIRSKKFTPTTIDDDLKGGEKALKLVASGDGSKFNVKVVVDDDPFTPGIQVDLTNTKTIKEVFVTVTLASPTPGWQTSVPATVVLRRVRAN